MNLNDEQPTPSNISTEELPFLRQTRFSNSDLDDTIGDDDDDDIDDDCLESTDEIQQILQTFGKHDCSPTLIDYYDSRRYEIMFELMNLEKQFDELKNILYEESISLIDKKLVAIQNEEAPEYQNEVKKLYDEMKIDLDVAKQRHHVDLQALDNSFQSELLSLEQTLENDKLLLFYNMREDIEEKIHELETLKMKTELCASILEEIVPLEQRFQHHGNIISSNKRHVESSESARYSTKKRRFNGTKRTVDKDSLAIFYQLSEINIIEDWAVIQASLQQSTSISDTDDNNGTEKSDTNDTHCDSNCSVLKSDCINAKDELTDDGTKKI